MYQKLIEIELISEVAMEIRDKDVKVWLRDLRSRTPGDCPGDEALSSFAEGRLSGSDREEVARHVIHCVQCGDVLAAVSIPSSAGLKVPRRLEKQAMELVPGSEPPWEIVVRFVTDAMTEAIEVIKNTGDRTQYFTPAYASVRGRRKPVRPGFAQGSLVAFTRKVGGMDTEVELECVATGTSEIKVTMKDRKGIAPRDVRVNLYRGEKELMSYTLHDGCVTFDKVDFGNYIVDFTRRGVRIGEIALDIRGEG